MSEPYRRRSTCRLCGSAELTLVLQLEPTPPANAFVTADALGEKQQCYPLDLFFCESCAHVQLLDVVDPRVLFDDYVYLSGTSPVFMDHFKGYAHEVIERFAPDESGIIVDIGSNDGTLLRFFKDAGYLVLGIDPVADLTEMVIERMKSQPSPLAVPARTPSETPTTAPGS